MIYASVGILALLVQLIINYDVLLKKTSEEIVLKNRSYRRFLFGTIFFYVTDILWGYFDEKKIIGMAYADTVLYFLAMSLLVMLWTGYITDYLEEKTRFGVAMKAVGQIFFAVSPVMLITNFFKPVLFDIADSGEYVTGFMRYILLTAQIVMFVLISVHTMILSFRTAESKRVRYRAISVYGFVMAGLEFVQVYNPLLPLYSVGCMLGNCLLHTFIIEDEKAEYRIKLEQLLQQEKESKQALRSARTAVNTDPLTGVKSRHAYLEMTERIDQSITDREIDEFGVIVFDINGLKDINDSMGHEEGDRFIRDGCMMICKKFTHSPVFRIGGDEFVVLLENSDYYNRDKLLSSFDERIEVNHALDLVEFATGMAVFDRERDTSFSQVFERADRRMYEKKKQMKNSEE
ncbi:MAG: GGDEF domain-containing protein [Ruminococcus sp.]|nr:GGDEF domain-containing protein [Ruminococcus sp.]